MPSLARAGAGAGAGDAPRGFAAAAAADDVDPEDPMHEEWQDQMHEVETADDRLSAAAEVLSFAKADLAECRAVLAAAEGKAGHILLAWS